MFEAQVLQLLRQYLGDYVVGLSAEALKISVWKGDVVLKDLQLKAEALNSLKLPVTVKAGFLGSVTLKVPWNRLGKESVVVLLDRIFILAEPIQDDRISKEGEKEKLLEAKRRQLEEAESAMLDAKKKKSNQENNTEETSSWLGSLIATIIGNLKISVTNVHIRYEDCSSNPGKPFSCGITLSKLAAVTIDENSKETFVTSGALDKLHKSMQLERLAVYHDSNKPTWNFGKSWSDMTPNEWCQIFEAGINSERAADSPLLSSVGESTYLLCPINGVGNYYRCGKKEKRERHVPLQSLSLVLNDVSLTVSENQYCDGLKLLEGVSRYKKRIEFSHFRPWVSVLEEPRTWWVYASQAGLKQQNKTWPHISWEKINHMCLLRRKYIQLYLESLQSKEKTENAELEKIEEEVETEILLLWRLLARAKAESMKSKEASSQQDQGKGGWWGFRWRSTAADKAASSPEAGTQKQDRELGDFTKEEWTKINELLNSESVEEGPQSETPDTLQIMVDATIKESAVRILDKEKIEILSGSFSLLNLGLNLYPNTIDCGVKLQSYGLSAPEGTLIRSMMVKDNKQALEACYVHHPLDSSLDWKVSATILPCYVTVWFASFDRFMQFLKSGNSISPDVASETATVLQNKLEQVRRRAQEQIKLALEEETRFSVSLDLDAPKIRIPGNSKQEEALSTQLVLDLGHFTLHTDNEEKRNRGMAIMQATRSLYSQCHISGNDIAAYLVNGPFEWERMQQFLSEYGFSGKNTSSNQNMLSIIPVIDRCSMFVLFEKLRIPHPAYPLTHVALQIPRLGLHFSTERYRNLLQVLETFDLSNGSTQEKDSSEMTLTQASWYPADCEGSMSVLVWKGIGNSVAEWQSCWSVLSGSYLYILDSANSQTYQRCFSINGKQTYDVPSSNIGGSDWVLAVCNKGSELKKGLESSSSVVMKLADQESKEMWQKALMAALFKLSARISVQLPEELDGHGVEDVDVQASDFLEQPVLFISGALHQLQLSVYAKIDENPDNSNSEPLLLSLKAGGGEVTVLQRQHDMTVGTNLHYLKIEDRLRDPEGTGCQYLARSIINRHTLSAQPENKVSEEGIFKDAMAEFGNSQNSSSENLTSITKDEEGQPEEELRLSSKEDFEALGLEHLKLAPGQSLLSKLFSNKDEETKSFVSVLLVTRQIESPDYDGTDVKMLISMATLELFCNRQTVVSLIEFGTEIGTIGDQRSEPTSASTTSSDGVENSAENTVVKGLLGQGKSRTVFHLRMGMDSVRVYLNLENEKKLAMLDQEGFHMDLKVFPGSFGINCTLGNLKIQDMTLDANHRWSWMCDLRDPENDSLVKLDFQSFNVDEEDYRGYDYCLSGKLSSVRIVFLYRFIQEVIAYFTALSEPHTQHFTRVVDKVGGIEKLVPQSEIDGSPAFKLNLFLETPMIIVPGSSASQDFMQLDLGYLKVINDFEWHGGFKDNNSAVHLDVLSVEISGISLVVGIEGVEGKSIIQDAQGLHLRVARPLRDMFKKAPEVQVDIQVQALKGILSDKEYLIISACAASNIAEAPNIPPDFRSSSDSAVDSEVISSEDSGLKRSDSEEVQKFKPTRTWTTIRLNVEVQRAELELHNGLERESPLARIEIHGLWINYRMSSLQEMTLLLTLPRLCILDLRPSTKPEMQLMLGSMEDSEDNLISRMLGSQENAMDPLPPMIVMDAKLKHASQAFILRVQRPRLLVVLDFLLAVGEFFVPSLAAVTGSAENLDSSDDPLCAEEHVRLVTAYFKQEEESVTLSPRRRLIVDFPDIDLFTYDGCGNTLALDAMENNMSSTSVHEPLIVIGPGKKLLFKNITIKNGYRLKDFVKLQCNSSYSICREDGVFLDGSATCDYFECTEQTSEIKFDAVIKPTKSTSSDSSDPVNFIVELQAVTPELTFYDSEMESYASSQRQEKLLRMKFDLNVMYAYRGSDVWLRAHMKRFSLDGGSGLTVIDPMVVSVEYMCVQKKTSLNVFASDFSVQLSFSLMRLLIRLHDSLISTLQHGKNHTLLKCTHFDRIWVNTGSTSGQKIAIWRPRAPRGFAILGDSITSGEAPPSQAVMAIRNIYRRAQKPLSFDLVHVIYNDDSSKSNVTSTKANPSKECSIWKPVAPPGYVALGCIAAIGSTPPPLTSVYCIRCDLVTSAAITDCVLYSQSYSGDGKELSIWRIENACASFIAHVSLKPPEKREICDIRDLLLDGESSEKDSFTSDGAVNQPRVGTAGTKPATEHERRPSSSGGENFGPTADPGRMIATTAQFERMWWDKGSDNRRLTSIWRPVPRPGYVFVGDHITEGLEPPGFGIILKDDNSGYLAEPVRLVQCMHVPMKGQEQLYAWYPVAPAGFVALGCVVSRNKDPPLLQALRCVRADLVNEVEMSRRPVWINARSGYNCSIWKLHNKANTFLARPDLKKPSDRLAYGLLETAQSQPEENLCADVKLARFSITILDDFRGLMTPLANISITSINLAANGRAKSLSGVCVASMAASTFNSQLDSWEPLIEPFEGIFKYESHDSQPGATMKAGKRIRVTSTSIVNVNVSSANLDVLIDSWTSWKRRCELEQRETRTTDAEVDRAHESSPISSALEEDDTEKVVLENKLGRRIFFRTYHGNFRDCEVLESGTKAQINVLPTKHGNKVRSRKLKAPYQYIAVHIADAHDLPINDDGNGQEYFYSLHVAPVDQSVRGQRKPSQSARSRCVRPDGLNQKDSANVAKVNWNEVFIFDLPDRDVANLDVRVSNQAANSGRGELIGTVSIPLTLGNNEQTEAASLRWKFLQQSLFGTQTTQPLAQEKTFFLELPAVESSDECSVNNRGSIVANIYYFSEKRSNNAETLAEGMTHLDEESTFLLGLSSNGPWSSIRSLIALGPVPFHIENSYMALEVAMHDGKKTAALRSLVTLFNGTDNALEVCACPVSLLSGPDDAILRQTSDPVVEVEEVFENQRYQPLAGWGSKWPGHFLPTDPGRWSSRDNKKNSQTREEVEAGLPPGWIWSTDWVIDKAGYVDDDGWAYAQDFPTLRWPPNSMKFCKNSPLDFVRRRRWCRSREQISKSDEVISREVISVIQPAASYSVPLSYVVSPKEFSLQVRPQLGSTLKDYLWGRSVNTGSQAKSEKQVSVFILNQLQKAEELLMCPPANPSASRTAWWLCMESDANILNNELNALVYDWKLSVNAPLKLENLLPCDAEYTIWERFNEHPVQRDRGVARAGSITEVFSVDTRKQIFLTWFVQGGWRSEKDTILISDPAGEELPLGFTLLNQQSGRRLNLSLERDFGTSNASSKTVRIFVPYWIMNKAALPLSYCLVEIDPAKGSDGDSSWLMKAVKAAKHASLRPSHSQQVKSTKTHRVVQCLEVLENNTGIPIMLSIQAQLNKTGFMPFSPRSSDAGSNPPRLGMSVCAASSNNFKEGISFKDLEDNERVIIKAMDESGAYYKLSVFLTMSSERTKVVNFQPHTLFINRLGHPLYIRQSDLDCAELLNPNDPPKVILWQSAFHSELIKVCLDGYEWSTPFSVETEGVVHVVLKKSNGEDKNLIKAEIRNGTTESRYLVIFRPVSFTSPYRIENHSLVFPICIRQVGGIHESWQSLPPGLAVPFAWEDLQRDHKLEIVVDDGDFSSSRVYPIDQCTSYVPVVKEGTSVAAFYVKVVEDSSTKVVKVGDWVPSDQELPVVPYKSGNKNSSSQEQLQLQELHPSGHPQTEDQMHVVLELTELGVSLVDHTPEEILYLSLQNFSVSYATGLGSRISRLKLRIDGIQLDNELPLTTMPVLLRNQGSTDPLNPLFKCTVTSQDDLSSSGSVYPYIGVQVPDAGSSTFLINLHEPIIWRLQQMVEHLNLSRLSSSETTDVSVDPIISIGLLNISEIRFKVSLAMSPSQRPRGALGFWASLMTALGNTDDLQIRIASRVHEDICMRQSALVASCTSSVRKDILSHPLLLLSGMDILGNASSALGHMSKGVAALSMDKKFIKSRQKQDTKASVEGFGDGFREGAGALGKGLFRGVTGILTKPLEGAKSSGVEGFVQGVGKGILGVAAQPVSGVLDLLSKTTEGANAVKTKIAAVITSEGVLMRHRLPRVIGADKILRPYDEYKAQGQVLLQLAEGGSMFGPMDIFKVRGKFAMTDAYEDHYNLPKGRTLIITHRRVILLHHPTSIFVQKKPDLMKDPCSVLWDVTWSNLGAMELSHGKHDTDKDAPSRLILHLRSGTVESKEPVRVVKCDPETNQASVVYSAIQQALSLYGPDQQGSNDQRALQNVYSPYAGEIQDPTSFEGPGTSLSAPAMASLSALLENPV